MKRGALHCVANWNLLNSDAWAHIFKHCTLFSLQWTIPLTCKRWRDISYDNAVWSDRIQCVVTHDEITMVDLWPIKTWYHEMCKIHTLRDILKMSMGGWYLDTAQKRDSDIEERVLIRLYTDPSYITLANNAGNAYVYLFGIQTGFITEIKSRLCENTMRMVICANDCGDMIGTSLCVDIYNGMENGIPSGMPYLMIPWRSLLLSRIKTRHMRTDVINIYGRNIDEQRVAVNLATHYNELEEARNTASGGSIIQNVKTAQGPARKRSKTCASTE